MEHGGKLNFTMDAWTSPNHQAFITFCVHLEHEGKLLTMPLDIIEVAKSHTSIKMASVFAKVLEDFRLIEKILAVTCNNTSKNDAMITELSTQVLSFVGSVSHTWCFLHIMNFIVNDNELAELVKELAEEEAAYLEKITSNPDDQETDEDDNDDGLVDKTSGLTDAQWIDLDRIIQSTTIVLPAWKEILSDLCLVVSCMPRDVYWKAIDLVTQQHELGLRKFKLTDHEWTAVLKQAILYFSCSTPNLTTVIPAMDHINHDLAAYSQNKMYLLSICATTSLATSNHYYLYTYKSEVYCIAMEDKWIKTTKVLVREEFVHSYATLTTSISNVFVNLPALAPPKPVDLYLELNCYLSSDIEYVTNPLNWWYKQCHTYLQLSCMVLDHLTILNEFSTSIDIEQLFSHGCLLLSHIHSQLSAYQLKLVKDDDVRTVSEMQDVQGNDEVELEDEWDSITVNN
ncbi:putative AC9 transposase [Scleroderma yunnanense]